MSIFIPNRGNAQGAKLSFANVPAFPIVVDVPNALNPGQVTRNVSMGLTTRDYFAAKAMHGFLQDYADDMENFPGIARDAYRMADAMIKARDGESDSQYHGDYLK